MASAIRLCLGLLLLGAAPRDLAAAEVDLLGSGLSLSQCFDPDATVAGGLTAGVVRNRRVYGPVDEFPGARLNTLTRGGSFNPNFRFNLLQAARLQLELEPPRNAGPANDATQDSLPAGG